MAPITEITGGYRNANRHVLCECANFIPDAKANAPDKVIDVSGEAFVDLANEAAAAFARL